MLINDNSGDGTMLNNDISDVSVTYYGGSTKNNTQSPFQNFVRSTTGKKLYYNDSKTGPLPPSKVTEATELHKSRQRVLYRGEPHGNRALGDPLHKITRIMDFYPPSLAGAKNDMRAKNFGLYEDEYDLKRQHDYYMSELNK